MSWYYSVRGDVHGPVSQSELLAMLRTGDLAPSTLIWREGMTRWTPARGVPHLDDAIRTIPPPLPDDAELGLEDLPATSSGALPDDATSVDDTEPHDGVHLVAHVEQPRASASLPEQCGDDRIHPWRRYLARTTDYVLFAVPGAFALIFVMAALQPRLLSTMLDGTSELLWSLLLVGFWVPIEAALLARFGTTPGKWLFGIRIAGAGGRRLTFSQAQRRAGRVWLRGMGCGIPLVTLFTHLAAYDKLKKKGVTPWDEDGGFTVSHADLGGGRLFGAGAVCVILFSIMVALGEDSEAAPQAPTPVQPALGTLDDFRGLMGADTASPVAARPTRQNGRRRDPERETGTREPHRLGTPAEPPLEERIAWIIRMAIRDLSSEADSLQRAFGITDEAAEGWLTPRYFADAGQHSSIRVWLTGTSRFVDHQLEHAERSYRAYLWRRASEAGVPTRVIEDLWDGTAMDMARRLTNPDGTLGTLKRLAQTGLQLHDILVRADPRVDYDAIDDVARFQDDKERVRVEKLVAEVERLASRFDEQRLEAERDVQLMLDSLDASIER